MADIVWDQKPVAGSSPAAGTAGNDFLAGLTEGPGSHEAAQKMKTAGNTLKTLAQNGSFAVNEEGFRAYMEACDFFLTGFDPMHYSLGLLAQNAKMGGSEYANKVAKFNTTVADGRPDSMLPNLQTMYEAVQTARDAMVIARKNYRENESANAVSFKELNKKLDNQ
ncbi:hypothetical protein [Amycolatopsis sp. NPDC004079]|uniref:hypothetical protein n=1 Tax=Amycolatopsis sp. NPDC004079 TaxID=3154549 RepID=UPI0033A3A773